MGLRELVLVNSNLGTLRFFIPLARLTKTTASREARDQGVFVRGQSQRRSAVWCLSPDTLILSELADDRSVKLFEKSTRPKSKRDVSRL